MNIVMDIINSLLYLYSEINDKNLEIELKYKPIKTNKESEDNDSQLPNIPLISVILL